MGQVKQWYMDEQENVDDTDYFYEKYLKEKSKRELWSSIFIGSFLFLSLLALIIYH